MACSNAMDTARAPRDDAGRFGPGTPVALRSINEYGRHGRAVGFTVAGTVIVDSGDFSVVATTPGSEVRNRAGVGSGPNGRLVLPDDWDGSYREATWFGSTVVRVHQRGVPWSVWRWHDGVQWEPDWYVNLETPWVRSDVGFDTQDWTLDVVARQAVDGWTVTFKDVDELEFLESSGFWSAERASSIRAAGEAARDAASARSWPFDAEWEAWLPQDGSPAALPTGWERVA